MKKISILVLLIVVFNSFLMGQATLENWSLVTSHISINKEASNVNDGSFAMKVVFTSQDNQDILSDAFAVIGGASYNFSFDVFDNDIAGRVRLSIKWNTNTEYKEIYSVDKTTWQTLSFAGTVPATATSAQVLLRFYDIASYWDGDAEIIIDNVIFTINGGDNLVLNPSFENWAEPVTPEYTIYNIQGQTSESPYKGDKVITNGIVTGIFSNGYFIQDGDGAWNGIFVYDLINNPELGDSITIKGTVDEYFQKTEIKNIVEFNINSSNNVLPNPVLVTSVNAANEMYEGVLVKINYAECTVADAGFGEWTVNDGSGNINVDDLMFAFTPEVGNIYDIIGIVDYANDSYKILPRSNGDIELKGNVIENALIDLASNYVLQISPSNQTVYVGEAVEIELLSSFPATIDPVLNAYYVDSYIEIIPTPTEDINITLFYEDNAGGSVVLGPFSIDAGTSSFYLSEIAGIDRNLLIGHAGIEQTWDINATNLIVGAYTLKVSTVTNTLSEFGNNDYILGNEIAYVTVQDIPELIIVSQTSNQVICQGADVELEVEVTGGIEDIEYKWFKDDEELEFDTNAITVSEEGAYVCVATSGSFQVSSDTIYVSVSIPEPFLAPIPSYCVGYEFTLNPGDFESYLWNDNSTNPTLTISESGEYSVTVTDEHGCTAITSVVVNYNSEIVIDLPEQAYLCPGDSIELAVNVIGEYLWSNQSDESSIVVTEAGIYSVTVTQGSCESVAEVEIIAAQNPEQFEFGDEITACDGSQVILVSPVDADSYLWSTGETTKEITVETSGTYTLTIFNEAGCSASNDIIVNFVNYIIVDLGDDVYSCPGATVVIDAVIGASWLWSDNSVDRTLSVTQSGIYYVTITDQYGCTGTDSIAVIFRPAPIVDLGEDVTFCSGSSLELIGPDEMIYSWSTGSTDQSIIITQTGEYSLTVTDEFGCQNSDAMSLNVLDSPLVDLGPDRTISEDQIIILGAFPGYSSYLWYNGATADYIVVKGADLGIGEHTIWVRIIASNDCETYEEMILTVVKGVGINPVVAESVFIYPNPSSEIVNINFGLLTGNKVVSLFDATGRCVYNNIFSDNIISIDINDLPSGAYSIVIDNTENIIRKTLLKF